MPVIALDWRRPQPEQRNADHQRPQAELEAAAWGGIGGHVAIIDSLQIGVIPGSGSF